MQPEPRFGAKEKALWRTVLCSKWTRVGPCSSLHLISLTFVLKWPRISKMHISCNMVAAPPPNKRANSLRKSDSRDIYYSLALKYSVCSQIVKDIWLATCVTSSKKHNLWHDILLKDGNRTKRVCHSGKDVSQ